MKLEAQARALADAFERPPFRGKSQKQIGEMLGSPTKPVSEPRVSTYINGKVRMPDDLRQRLAKLLGTTPEELFPPEVTVSQDSRRAIDLLADYLEDILADAANKRVRQDVVTSFMQWLQTARDLVHGATATEKPKRRK